jgi:hypothetical protein
MPRPQHRCLNKVRGGQSQPAQTPQDDSKRQMSIAGQRRKKKPIRQQTITNLQRCPALLEDLRGGVQFLVFGFRFSVGCGWFWVADCIVGSGEYLELITLFQVSGSDYGCSLSSFPERLQDAAFLICSTSFLCCGVP